MGPRIQDVEDGAWGLGCKASLQAMAEEARKGSQGMCPQRNLVFQPNTVSTLFSYKVQ